MLNSILLIAGFGAPEILAVILRLFGGRNITELMRGLGRGVREFKDAKDGDPSKEGDRRE